MAGITAPLKFESLELVRKPPRKSPRNRIGSDSSPDGPSPKLPVGGKLWDRLRVKNEAQAQRQQQKAAAKSAREGRQQAGDEPQQAVAKGAGQTAKQQPPPLRKRRGSDAGAPNPAASRENAEAKSEFCMASSDVARLPAPGCTTDVLSRVADAAASKALRPAGRVGGSGGSSSIASQQNRHTTLQGSSAHSGFDDMTVPAPRRKEKKHKPRSVESKASRINAAAASPADADNSTDVPANGSLAVGSSRKRSNEARENQTDPAAAKKLEHRGAVGTRGDGAAEYERITRDFPRLCGNLPARHQLRASDFEDFTIGDMLRLLGQKSKISKKILIRTLLERLEVGNQEEDDEEDESGESDGDTPAPAEVFKATQPRKPPQDAATTDLEKSNKNGQVGRKKRKIEISSDDESSEDTEEEEEVDDEDEEGSEEDSDESSEEEVKEEKPLDLTDPDTIRALQGGFRVRRARVSYNQDSETDALVQKALRASGDAIPAGYMKDKS